MSTITTRPTIHANVTDPKFRQSANQSGMSAMSTR
jgi:hypothetical protein